MKEYKELKHFINNPKYSEVEVESMKENYKHSRNVHRKLVRSIKAKKAIERDENLFHILSSNPSKIFKSIKGAKRIHLGQKGPNKDMRRVKMDTKKENP